MPNNFSQLISKLQHFEYPRLSLLDELQTLSVYEFSILLNFLENRHLRAQDISDRHWLIPLDENSDYDTYHTHIVEYIKLIALNVPPPIQKLVIDKAKIFSDNDQSRIIISLFLLNKAISYQFETLPFKYRHMSSTSKKEDISVLHSIEESIKQTCQKDYQQDNSIVPLSQYNQIICQIYSQKCSQFPAFSISQHLSLLLAWTSPTSSSIPSSTPSESSPSSDNINTSQTTATFTSATTAIDSVVTTVDSVTLPTSTTFPMHSQYVYIPFSILDTYHPENDVITASSDIATNDTVATHNTAVTSGTLGTDSSQNNASMNDNLLSSSAIPSVTASTTTSVTSAATTKNTLLSNILPHAIKAPGFDTTPTSFVPIWAITSEHESLFTLYEYYIYTHTLYVYLQPLFLVLNMDLHPSPIFEEIFQLFSSPLPLSSITSPSSTSSPYTLLDNDINTLQISPLPQHFLLHPNILYTLCRLIGCLLYSKLREFVRCIHHEFSTILISQACSCVPLTKKNIQNEIDNKYHLNNDLFIQEKQRRELPVVQNPLQKETFTTRDEMGLFANITKEYQTLTSTIQSFTTKDVIQRLSLKFPMLLQKQLISHNNDNNNLSNNTNSGIDEQALLEQAILHDKPLFLTFLEHSLRTLFNNQLIEKERLLTEYIEQIQLLCTQANANIEKISSSQQ